MAAANFTDSLLFHLWQRSGIRFVEDTEPYDRLRYTSHQNVDPREWIERHFDESIYQLEPTSSPTEAIVGERNEGAIKSALDGWRANGSEPGFGNQHFFILAMRLASAGVPEWELITMLRSEAQFANKPAERRQQIRSIIPSLKNYRLLA
jgi:hypothetical protein